MAHHPVIALNKRASFDYTFLEKWEAGLVLQGWEIKSLRAGKANISQGHIVIRQAEAWWIGGIITPLIQASSHKPPEADRTRKLLLKQRELRKLIGAIERKGLTIIPLKLYWKGPYVKLEVALAQGKKMMDKRAATKERDWNRQKQRILKQQR